MVEKYLQTVDMNNLNKQLCRISPNLIISEIDLDSKFIPEQEFHLLVNFENDKKRYNFRTMSYWLYSLGFWV